jgi:hypothetical protein
MLPQRIQCGQNPFVRKLCEDYSITKKDTSVYSRPNLHKPHDALAETRRAERPTWAR